MRKTTSGFTIVELLVVVVVIGVLAGLVISTFAGAQARARDAKRVTDLQAIQKALETYKADRGIYPAPHTTTAANLPAGFTGLYGCIGCYAYSVATDGTWLKGLKDSGIMAAPPTDPVNDNAHFYMYWASGPNGYGACTEPFYVLAIKGFEAGKPTSSRGVYCTSGTSNFYMNDTGDLGVFSNIRTTLP